MAKGFNLTAQINLRGPTNLKPIVADIRRQLGSISSDVNVKLNPQVAKSISTVTSRLKSMNDMLVTAKSNSDSLNTSLSNLSTSLSSIGNSGSKSVSTISKTASSTKTAAQNIKQATTEMEQFGKQSALAVRRFAAFSLASGAIFKLVNAINSGFNAFVNFDKQLVKLQQVTGKGAIGLKNLENQITNLATSLGVSSESLIEVASTLAQAGLNAEETRIALSALAKTELAPSFDSLTETTEGAIAALRQFELQAGDLESALGSINAVAAAFAVESSDIITAIQRTGGVFAAASKGVSEGKDALNEFIAVFTSVRATTRESAETIATGLRTIFTRIQRGKTIEALKEYGVILTDLEGKFVGPYEAVKRLSEGLKLLDPRDLRFSQIVEELGGFRQIGKVIPLIQQFSEAQKALIIAQTGQSSLTDAQVTAQKSLANQIVKVREQFLALIRDVGKSATFQAITKIVLNLTSAFISLAGAFKPILPFLAILGTIKGVKALGEFGTGFFGGLKRSQGGGTSTAKNIGTNIGNTISGSKEKEKAAATKLATDAIQANTSALKSLTVAINSLDNTIKSRGSTTFATGGKVLGFNSGGIVPGSGKGDKVPALLEPGEVIINNRAANKYGRGNLVRMNKYVGGGKVNITAQELKGRSRSSKAIENLITDDEDMALYGSGRAINTLDNISFNRRIYKLYDKDSINDWNGFEEAVQKRVGGTRTNIGKNDPSFPIDIIGSNLGPLEVRNRNESTSNRTLLDKLIRYYISKPDFSKLQNRPTPDDIPLGNIGVVYNSAKYDPPNAKELMTGGKIQKFMAGSPGGIRVASGKGRGVKRSKGARGPAYDVPSTENFVEWAKGIYSEYDADSSLPTASFMGMSLPVEIAYANYLLGKFLERGGSGLSTGKKFIVTPPDKIDDALRPYLVPNPNNPSELGFFGDDKILAFQRANKTELQLREDQKRADELSKRKTTSKMQRELFGFALKGIGADIEAGNFSKDEIETLKEGLPGITKNPYLQVTSLPQLKDEAIPASSSLLSSIGGPLSEFRKSGGQKSLAGVIPAEAAAKIKETIPSYIESMKDEAQKATKAKTALKYFDAFVGGSTADKPGHATAFVETINQILKSGMISGLADGGMVQKFMAGSVGGVMEQTEEALPSDLAGLIKEIATIGGPTALYDFVPKPEIKSILKEKKVFPRPTAKQLVSSSWLTAKTPDLYGDRDKYIEPLKEVVKRARARFNTKQSGIQAQLLRNVQAASGQGYKFGLASIYGPNGELGYSSTSKAKEIEGPDGTKYLTQIIRKGLPERYLDAVRATSQDIAGVPARAAERLQYTDIFGTGGPLAFDFDETLVKGSDIPGKNPADYSDLNKVQEALKNAELTLLGKELSRRISEYPQLLDSIRVLTARPQSNAPYLASTLAGLGLPIPANKITGVSGGLNKVNNLSELETLIDDNLENVQSVMAGGKRAIPYSEPLQTDASSRSIQVMEGYALEEMVKNLGVKISPDGADPLRPIDYPNGLGSYARYWGLPPNIPTDTKRTNSSSALTRLFDEAERFYAKNFAVGGIVKLNKGGYSRSPSKLVPNDPSFEPGSMSVGSKGIDYISILENSGLDLQSWLINKLAFEAKTNQFSENEILEYARRVKEQMGSRPKTNVQNLLETLRQPARFAIGGLADATEKNFGKIGLRASASEITATYFKNAEREGMVTAKKASDNLFTIGLSKATSGYGPKLYDVVMEAATSSGSMLTSDRNSVSGDAKKVWDYYFNNRGDVTKTPLDPKDWTKNSALLDPKLYGKKETWPPFNDPAWTLQTGYSKAPSDINNTSLVQRLAGGGSANTVPAMVSNGEAFVPPKVAKKIGYAKLDKMNQADRNGMKGFAGGGISVFKGPGSGTSDSIGPIGLPTGSYVIREKATKALGLNRGGIVGGIKKFFKGGQSKKDAVRAQGQILSTVEEGATVFADIMSQLPTQLKDIILSKFKGIQNVQAGQAVSSVANSPAFTERTRGMAVASSKASAIGLQITGKKGGATTETVAHETGHLADIALGGGSNFASETQGTFQFELIAKIKKQMEDEFKKAGKSAEEIDKYLGTGKELFAEFFAKASPEVRAIITSTTDAKVGMEKLVNALGETGFTYAGLEASDLAPPKPKSKKSKQKDQFGYLKQQSKAIDEAKIGAVSFESLKPKTKTRREAKQELDDSGLKALTTGITQTSGEIAKLKAQTESLYQQSKSLDNQIGQYDQAILKIRSSTEEGAKGNKALNRIIQMKISAETQRLSVDKQAMAGEEQLITLNKQKAQQIVAAKTFKTTGGGGGGPGGGGPPDDGPFGLGPEDPVAKQRREQKFADQEFFKYKAAQTGTSEAGVKLDLAQRLGRATYESKELFSGKVSESKTGLVTRRESAMKVGSSIQSAQKAIEQAKKSGDDEALKAATQQLADANSRLAQETEGILQQMIELRPDLAATEEGMKKLTQASNEVAQELSTGNLAAAQEKLGAAVAGTGKGGGLSAEEAVSVARTRVAKETGVDSGLLQREFGAGGASAKMAKQQAFIQSTEGQRFGKLAEFAPGLAQKIAGSKAGAGLAKGADFISGKGGKFSKGFAALGGFQGIGSGLAVGSEALKTSGLIDKKTLKSPNVAGAFGAVQGAGVMGATGAELGGQLAGPIGALVGGIGGAVIGGIKGFFDAKNAQILGNALDKLTKSSEGVDIAFKELAKNDTDKNFKNVQKAFGQQIEASKQLENIAFGGDGEGPSVGGVGGGALAGAAGGALIGSFIPVIGTAIGAAVGAAIGGGVAYLSEGQNKANREEALRSRVGSAGAMNESAARMAERQMGRMTTEELGKQQQTGANVIAEQYKQSAIAAAEAANGTKNLTAAQKEQISQSAAETAYLDAYMKIRKEAGATDEKISEDILADRKLALQEGKKALQVQNDAAVKQALLARATKEVALATENLLDVYRRVGAKAQRFSDEVDDMLSGTQSTIASLGGNAAVQKVDRTGSERILGNMAAYSSSEVKAATQEMVGKLGGGEEAQALGKQAEAAKFLQDKLPAMLREPGADPSKIIDSLSQELSTMGLGGDAIDKMLGEIEKQISDNEKGGLGTLADEISSGGIDKLSMTAAEAAKTLQNLSKTYNDTLQKSIDLQNQYNETIMQSNEYLRKAGTIRINAELDLAKALGNSPILEQLNQPFDFEIQDLTKGLVPGGTSDPAAIAAGIAAKTAENQQLQAANANLGNVGMTGASGDAGAKLLSEQQKNIAAMGANSVAINEGRQALEKLANDGTKAANALAKIEEQQRQIEGLGNRFEKIFTSSPEELFKMNRQSDALALAQTAGAEQFKSRAFRQDAFAGLEQDKEFLSPEEYRKQRGMLMRKSLESQGYTGQSMIQKGGVNMTVDDFIKRIEGGMPSEEDPNVKAYREAVATQIKANEELARLEELKSLQIQEAMLGLQTFLANEFPKILTDAVKASREDAETKPSTKTEPTKAEKNKLEADKKYDTAKAKRDQIEGKITEEKRALAKAEKNVGWEQGAGVEVKQRKNKIKELQAQAAQQTSIMNEADAASAEAERSMTQEKKAKDQAKAAQAAEEKKAKEATVSTSIEQSQRARAGVAPTVIPAPPAPGSVEAKLEENRKKQADLIARQNKATETQTGTQQPNEMEQMQQANKEFIEARKKVKVYNQGIQGQPEDIKTYNESLEKLNNAKAAVAERARVSVPKPSSQAQTAAATYGAVKPITQATPTPQISKEEMQILDQLPSIKDMQGFRGQKETEVSKLEKQVKIARASAEAAGPRGTKSQEYLASKEAALASAKGDLSQLDKSIADKQAAEAIVRQQNQPIPSNIPKPVEYSRQVQAAETTGSTQTTKPTETTGQLLTLDQTSLDRLNTFNTNFGAYVDKLVNFQFPTIPEKIEMTGTHTVDVRVTGAAAFESLQKNIQDMINKEIDVKMTQIWQQTGGQIGQRPGTPPSKGR